MDQPFNGVVGTFTDANIYAVAGDFTATVQWGDGTSDTSGDGNLTITQPPAPASTFLVTGTHTYTTATTGHPPDILRSTSPRPTGPNPSSRKGPLDLQSHAPRHLQQLHGIVGVAYTGPVATFTDDAPDPNLGDYSATINWGDGTPTNPDVTSGRISLANRAGQGFIVTDAGGAPLPERHHGPGALCRHGHDHQDGHGQSGQPLG